MKVFIKAYRDLSFKEFTCDSVTFHVETIYLNVDHKVKHAFDLHKIYEIAIEE